MQTFDFAALLEALPDAVVVADMQSRIVYANASVQRVLGWPPDALVGQHLHAIQPERLHEAHDASFGRYAATGERKLFGTPVRLPALARDGIEHDVELNLAEITGPGGERLVLGVIRDLTERVELERGRAAADRSRAHFELLAQVSERLAASLDPEVTVQAVADAVVPTFADWCIVDLVREDRTLETVASAHRDPRLVDRIVVLRSSYPPAERTNPPHSIYRALEEGRTIRETVTADDLARRAVDPNHLALLNELGIGSHLVATLAIGGKVIGAVSLVRGPDRAPFDDVDSATAEGVARRAAIATQNSRLYRSAQQAIEMRDRFLAVASHELRTPLSVVYGHWELLARWLRSDPEAARPNADKIEISLQRLGRGVDQLRRLVEELLDVSRLAHGTIDLRRSPVDLATVVREAVDDASASAASGRLSLEHPDGAVIGQWDAARLRQVVDNLLLNALKYSPGDRPVKVALTREGRHARLRITDEGIGIPADELESIFEPFNRAHNASAQHFPGLGLGLAVSREIVNGLGGRMWAESEGEGRGSSFVVELDPEDSGDPSPSDATDVGAQR